MVKSFLPGVRGLVALNLREKGLSQGKIAKMIGVTQVAVNHYLRNGPKFYSEKLALVGLTERDTSNLTDLLTEDLFVSQVDAIYTLYSLWRGYLSRGKICSTHQNMVHTLSNCEVCMKFFGDRDSLQPNRREILDGLSHAVKLLEASPYFPKIMPEVSVNIVFADSMARGESDIAAMPGRIVKVHDRAKAMMAPEFGVSHHMAKVLFT
ncbi:MAG: thiamine-phosphate synthase family protein, partial [Nitrososphaerales archaeon]